MLFGLESASAMEELRYLIRGDQFKIEFIEVFKKSKDSGNDYNNL